jgi:hypothetical protein
MRARWASTVIAGVLLLVHSAAAQPARWQTYVHPDFATRIDYPAYLFPDGPFLTATGVSFEGDGTYLEIFARRWDAIDNVEDLLAFLEAGPGYENVTYSPRGDRWLVISGYRGDSVFYEKFFVVNGTVQAFFFEYPRATRALYDPLVELLEDSFRYGPG